MKKLLFTKKLPTDFTTRESLILNFLNMESIWHYKKNHLYRKLISREHNINFPDGRLISLVLRTKQIRGPTFTREFLMTSKDKKHFFIGNVDIEKMSKIVGIPEEKMSSYNPPYINELEFSSAEKKKTVKILKKFNPDYIWVCIGAPKQEILANQLFNLYPSFYFSVGAAIDFLLKKKSEAPRFWRMIGLEWFYRGLTDFKHSRIKILRSLSGLRYLRSVGLE